MRRLLLSILITSAFSHQSGLAQEKDANIWTGVSLDVPIIENLGVSYGMETRFYENATRLQNYFNEIGVGYKLPYGFKVSLKYRLSRKHRTNWWGNENRFCLDARYRYKIDEINTRVYARMRYQYAFDRWGIVNDEIYPRVKHLYRLKLKAAYKNPDFKRVVPFVSYELFAALNPVNPLGMDAWRFSFGATLDLPKRLEAGIQYIFEKENRSVPRHAHIYAFSIGYSLKDPILEKQDPGTAKSDL